jgi:hypothetical protein
VKRIIPRGPLPRNKLDTMLFYGLYYDKRMCEHLMHMYFISTDNGEHTSLTIQA